jgi:endonuclease YncB( thermonuclease family)
MDAPEGRQLCRLEAHDWPCGQAATAAVDALVGSDPVACEVYGHDRWGRALAVCQQNGLDLNAEIVRNGWALAWYPESGAVLGPSYAAAQAEAEVKQAGIWQGEFTDPWVWRRQTN